MRFPREKNGFFGTSCTTYLDQNWLSLPSQAKSFYLDSAQFFVPSEAVSILLGKEGGVAGGGGEKNQGLYSVRGGT